MKDATVAAAGRDECCRRSGRSPPRFVKRSAKVAQGRQAGRRRDLHRSIARGSELLQPRPGAGGPQQGRRSGAALQKAVEADPKFARAYSGWGLSAFKLGRRSEAEAKWTQALKLLDRMTERERYRTLGLYYSVVSLDYDKAIDNYKQLVKLYPADGAAHNNLAISYFMTLNFPQALAEGKRVLDIYPEDIQYRANYALYAMYASDRRPPSRRPGRSSRPIPPITSLTFRSRCRQ